MRPGFESVKVDRSRSYSNFHDVGLRMTVLAQNLERGKSSALLE